MKKVISGRLGKVLAVVAVAVFCKVAFVWSQLPYRGVGGTPSEQVTFLQTATPGWAPPGSLWIVGTNNGAIKVQTNQWNQNTTIIYSNYSSYCISNCAAGTNAVMTNVFLGTYYTGTVPSATWVQVK